MRWGKKVVIYIVFQFKKSASARFVKVIAVPFKGLPKGHSGEGEPPFLFVDEIRVH